jgi:hypothetical protein
MEFLVYFAHFCELVYVCIGVFPHFYWNFIENEETHQYTHKLIHRNEQNSDETSYL